MFEFLPDALPTLWAQATAQPGPDPYYAFLSNLYIYSDPQQTVPGLKGGILTWVKVVGIFCLLGWVVSWVATALKERTVARGSWLDIAALVAIIGGVGTVLLRVLEANQRIPIYRITLGGVTVYSVTLLTLAVLGVLFLWVENAVWSTIRKLGGSADVAILVGMHLALALGVTAGFVVRYLANRMAQTNTLQAVSWADGLNFGARFSATYMGYVVLAFVAARVFQEVFAIRFRRIYSIARVSVIEATRRMWAPWVVVTVFLVILAFTHWFLQPPRPAEMGRLFVGTLMLLCSLLLTVMVTLLTPLSLPQDIQNQTIYTVVSKPVRRIELIWGRMLGFMSIVTVLVGVFGAISLFYLWRTVGGTIRATEAAAVRATKSGNTAEAKLLREQADQLRTRMAARVPVYGSLTFLDSRGTPRTKGIDVGQEQSMREPRSHIEGATPATAIWKFGYIPDPRVPPRAGRPPILTDRSIPVDLFLAPDSVEGLQDRFFRLGAQIAQTEAMQNQRNVAAKTGAETSSNLAKLRDEQKAAGDAYNKAKAKADDLAAKAAAAAKAGQADEARRLRADAAAMHSPDIEVEMTFNVYRTTKGRVGEPVYAELEATNPISGKPYRQIFPIREYYTNKLKLPAEILTGCAAAPPGQEMLQIEVRCISPTQYLGMAESDMFLLAHSGDFGTNFMKGLFGVWLQAMVLTAIGVFAGTFLSWPVALLTTIAFFIAGQVAFAFLVDFTRQSVLGGGPFESLIRLLAHDNQMNDLTPTLSVVTAKTLDSIVMPVMSMLVYVVPNFSALDVSNTVADGFAVTWPSLVANSLLAFAYALPFSIAGYFILKNREVAA